MWSCHVKVSVEGQKLFKLLDLVKLIWIFSSFFIFEVVLGLIKGMHMKTNGFYYLKDEIGILSVVGSVNHQSVPPSSRHSYFGFIVDITGATYNVYSFIKL